MIVHSVQDESLENQNMDSDSKRRNFLFRILSTERKQMVVGLQMSLFEVHTE